MGLTTILPTLGRPTLERAIRSVLAAQNEGDRLIVAGDGYDPAALCAALADEHDREITSLACHRTGDLGCSQRAAALELVEPGTWVEFLGDDDALPAMAHTILEDYLVPGYVLLRRVYHAPSARLLCEENMCDGMLVAEHRPDGWGPWWTEHGGDSRFVLGTIEKRGGWGKVLRCAEYTYLIRPQEGGAL